MRKFSLISFVDKVIDTLEVIFYPWRKISRKRFRDRAKRQITNFQHYIFEYPQMQRLFAEIAESSERDDRFAYRMALKLKISWLLPKALFCQSGKLLAARKARREKEKLQQKLYGKPVLNVHKAANSDILRETIKFFGYESTIDPPKKKYVARPSPQHKNDVFTNKTRTLTDDRVVNAKAAGYLKPGDYLSIKKETTEEARVAIYRGRAKVGFMDDDDSQLFSRALDIGAGMYAIVTSNYKKDGKRTVEYEIWVKNRAKREKKQNMSSR